MKRISTHDSVVSVFEKDWRRGKNRHIIFVDSCRDCQSLFRFFSGMQSLCRRCFKNAMGSFTAGESMSRSQEESGCQW
jgi:hypothetical protein